MTKLATVVSLAFVMVFGPVIGATAAEESKPDGIHYEVVVQYRDTQKVVDPFTGRTLVLEGTRTILRPAGQVSADSGLETTLAGGCTLNGWQGDPYVNMGYGDAYAMAHAYWSVSSGCASGKSWTQTLQVQNVFGAWTNVDSDYGFAAPGGSWYTTVSKRCLNSNVEQWRSTWTEWPSSTPTVNLQCDT